ncbi:MAG TPA: DedA family protein [Candidatus Binataceae bacterium]|nr:DedA family protein [Candidatus Binataceae bacterium]
MFEKILTFVSTLIIATISTLGYGGVVLMMAIESACIPLPSEVIMPFSGYLVSTGRFGLQAVAIAGAVGCLLGSYVAYFIGMYGGRPFLVRYGRYVLVPAHEIEIADRFFARWGSHAVFFSRLLPVVRTFIALPAGIARMDLRRFSIYTLLGSYPWCLALAYVGMKLGQHWPDVAPYFHRFDTVIGIVIIVSAVAFVYNRIRAISRESAAVERV